MKEADPAGKHQIRDVHRGAQQGLCICDYTCERRVKGCICCLSTSLSLKEAGDVLFVYVIVYLQGAEVEKKRSGLCFLLSFTGYAMLFPTLPP